MWWIMSFGTICILALIWHQMKNYSLNRNCSDPLDELLGKAQGVSPQFKVHINQVYDLAKAKAKKDFTQLTIAENN